MFFQKLFSESSLAIVRHSSTSRLQQPRPLPSLLCDSVCVAAISGNLLFVSFRQHTKRWDWWHIPISLLQGDKGIGMVLVIWASRTSLALIGWQNCLCYRSTSAVYSVLRPQGTIELRPAAHGPIRGIDTLVSLKVKRVKATCSNARLHILFAMLETYKLKPLGLQKCTSILQYNWVNSHAQQTQI